MGLGALHLPKQSFIQWLATQDRLFTAQRMLHLHLNPQSLTCILCEGTEIDPIQHMLFCCPWTKMLLKEITDSMGITYSPRSLNSYYTWLKKSKGTK